MSFGSAIVLVGCLFFIAGITLAAVKKHFLGAFLVCVGIVCLLIRDCWETKNQNSFYYYPCEIVAQNEQYTYFAQIGEQNAPIYCCETNPEWSIDTCYLLYMDANKTPEREDDQIVVVWRQ